MTPGGYFVVGFISLLTNKIQVGLMGVILPILIGGDVTSGGGI